MATILTKKKDTTGAPSAGDLTNSSGGAELAVNTADKRLYTKDSGGNVVEVGINPTSITTGTLNTSGAVVFNDAGADVDFRVEGDTDANLLFVDASADRVGIGTNTPDLTFQVEKNGNSSITIGGILNTDTGNAAGAGFAFGNNASAESARIVMLGSNHSSLANTFLITNDQNGPMAFRTNGTERMRITSSGNVGIGTSSPAYKLDINEASTYSTIGLRQGGTLYGYIEGGSSIVKLGTNAAIPLSLDTNGTERARITSGGYFKASNTGSYNDATANNHELVNSIADIASFRLGNSNASSPYGQQIVFSGASPNNGTNYFLACDDSTARRAAILSNGGLSNYSANDVNLSDERVKKDIADLGSQWNCIKEWNLVEFRYKEQEENTPKNYGVIAQQIQEHCPEVVTVFQEAAEAVEAKEAVLDEEGNVIEPAVEAKPAVEERIGVREQQMLWMAVKALQEAMERIETLEAKVAALENA